MFFYYFTMTVSLIVILKECERTGVLEPREVCTWGVCVCVLRTCMSGRVILVGNMMASSFTWWPISSFLCFILFLSVY